MKRVPLPNTRFQRWLAERAACYNGRKAVGRKTYRQFITTTRNRDYLQWLVYERCGWVCDCYNYRDGVCPYHGPLSQLRASLLNAGEPWL